MSVKKPFSVTGINLDEALKLVEELGGSHKTLNRTGELQVKLPGYQRAQRVNSRRKDTPKALAARLGKLLRKRDKAEKVDSDWLNAFPPALSPPAATPPAPAATPPGGYIRSQDDAKVYALNEALKKVEAAFAHVPQNGQHTDELKGQVSKLSEDQAVLLDFITKVSERVDRLEQIVLGGVKLIEERMKARGV